MFADLLSEIARGRVPVIAGCGYGTAIAIGQSRDPLRLRFIARPFPRPVRRIKMQAQEERTLGLGVIADGVAQFGRVDVRRVIVAGDPFTVDVVVIALGHESFS